MRRLRFHLSTLVIVVVVLGVSFAALRDRSGHDESLVRNISYRTTNRDLWQPSSSHAQLTLALNGMRDAGFRVLDDQG